MISPNLLRHTRFACGLRLIFINWIRTAQPIWATDYFLTIGGGYDRTGNQASLEAHVVFFQQLLKDQHREPRRQDIYFADGDDGQRFNPDTVDEFIER